MRRHIPDFRAFMHTHTNLLSEEQSSSEPASGVDPITIASLNASWYHPPSHSNTQTSQFSLSTVPAILET